MLHIMMWMHYEFWPVVMFIEWLIFGIACLTGILWPFRNLHRLRNEFPFELWERPRRSYTLFNFESFSAFKSQQSDLSLGVRVLWQRMAENICDISGIVFGDDA